MVMRCDVMMAAAAAAAGEVGTSTTQVGRSEATLMVPNGL